MKLAELMKTSTFAALNKNAAEATPVKRKKPSAHWLKVDGYTGVYAITLTEVVQSYGYILKLTQTRRVTKSGYESPEKAKAAREGAAGKYLKHTSDMTNSQKAEQADFIAALRKEIGTAPKGCEIEVPYHCRTGLLSQINAVRYAARISARLITVIQRTEFMLVRVRE